MSAGLGIAAGFFTSAAAGILGALLIPPFQELRRFFFALNAGIAFAFLCLAAPLRPSLRSALRAWEADSGGAVALVVTLAAALAPVLVIIYIGALYRRDGGRARGILMIATAAALTATAADGWQAGREAGAGWIFCADALAAAGLLGSVIVAMILGHWYLVRWRLPAGHLVRFSVIMAGAIGLRALLCLLGLLVVGARSPVGLAAYLADVTVRRGFFFWSRVFFGLLAPATFAYMVHETARIRSTQSATGILYVTVISVVIGEFLARFLTVAGAGPM
ncbi:MAG TPA: hypothetical protein VJ144_07630 [Candidatus Polarisedimenticolia bacterium]|nr:hypothetical protein [Candidatus Polarisedimenticolia bacterium]